MSLKVVVSPVANVVPAQSICVEPASEDDWEITELHAEYLEQQILNQINIVFPGNWHLYSIYLLLLTQLGEYFPLSVRQTHIKFRIGTKTCHLILTFFT